MILPPTSSGAHAPSSTRFDTRWLYLLLLVAAAVFCADLPRILKYPKVDFASYYYAARSIDLGRASAIYEPSHLGKKELGYEQLPYLYPPTLSLALSKTRLSKLPFKTASTVWFGAQVLALIHVVWM